MRKVLPVLVLLLGACGFQPTYAPGGAGAALQGRVAVDAPDTPDGYRLRAALEERLGPPGADALRLAVAIEVTEAAAAVTPEGAITRRALEGTADWRLEGPGGPVARGRASDATGASATGSTVAAAAAATDARARLMTLLADEIVARLLLLPPGAVP